MTSQAIRTRRWRTKHPEKRRLIDKNWRDKNREKINAQARIRYARNPKKFIEKSLAFQKRNFTQTKERKKLWQQSINGKQSKRRYDLNKSYSLSLDSFESLLKIQKARCRICLEPFKKETPHVDHCHKNGTVRGLLCRQCNVGLAMFRDSPKYLENAIKYLCASSA